MRILAVDSWAFVETALDKPRSNETRDALDEADQLVTCRDILVETFNLLVHRTRQTDVGWDWWESIRESSIRVMDPRLGELREFVAGSSRSSNLSLSDYALAMAARTVGAKEVVTEDQGFRALGLVPLFKATKR